MGGYVLGLAGSGQTMTVALVLTVGLFYVGSIFGNNSPICVSQSSSNSSSSSSQPGPTNFATLWIPEIGMNVCPLKFNEYITLSR